MTPPEPHLSYLADIRSYAREAVSFAAGMNFAEFSSDEKTVFAVVRAFEVIGEAAKRVPDDVRSRHPGVPWRQMTGTRDRLIHHYTRVNLTVLWEALTVDLPDLLPRLDAVIAAESAPAA